MTKLKVIAILFFLSGAVMAQGFRAPLSKGQKQLNMGLGFDSYGLPIYGSVDFAVHDEVTIGPQVNIVFYDNITAFSIGFRGDYHFNRLFEITPDWDVYGGANIGVGFNGHDDLDLGLQIGGRYYWSRKWGLNLEFAGGNTFSTKLGVSMKF